MELREGECENKDGGGRNFMLRVGQIVAATSKATKGKKSGKKCKKPEES